MAFTWAMFLVELKEYMAGRKTEDWFISSLENSREMRTTYTILGNFTKFYEWVERKAAEEALGSEPGAINHSIAG